MHCVSCNNFLSDREATLKSAMTGEHLDLCFNCLELTDIITMENPNVSDEPPELTADFEPFDPLHDEPSDDGE